MCHPGHFDAEKIRDPRLRTYHDWEAASSTHVAVFLAKIIEVKDINNGDAIPNPNVAEFNSNLETLVSGPGGRIEAGDDVTMADQNSALTYPDDLSVDLAHPLPSGYEKMANTWLEALQSSQKLPGSLNEPRWGTLRKSVCVITPLLVRIKAMSSCAVLILREKIRSGGFSEWFENTKNSPPNRRDGLPLYYLPKKEHSGYMSISVARFVR